MKKMIRTVNLSDSGYLRECTDFIEGSLRSLKTPSKMVMRSVLLSEEMIVALADRCEENAELDICVNKRMGDIRVDITAPGEEIDTDALSSFSMDDGSGSDMDADDREMERKLRSLIIKSQGEKLKNTYKNGYNKISIAVGKAERSSLVLTITALVLGLIAGLILTNLVPETVTEGICTYALQPVKTMFMNALKIIVGPVVFFSLVTCFSQFKNLSELGRIFAKVMGLYMLTTVLASLIALGFSTIFQPGVWGAGLGMATTQAVNVNTNTDTSLLSTIVGIIPDNFVKPFLEANTLQLIFLALICGLAVGALGEYSAKLSNLFQALNELFLTITTMIAKFIPLAAFCSVVLMVVKVGGEAVVSLLGMFGVFLICIASMLTVYGILLILIGRLNPLTFYRKIREGMLTSFALSSSSATVPTNMMICTERLGISPKLVSFSIPLGATVNMDGTCVSLIVSGLFLARMYGISVTGPELASMVVTVVLLSLGCPGVPGAGLVCLGIVLQNIGVPIEAIGLVMAIDPIRDMFGTMNNVTGDMAVTAVVGKTEGMMDMDIYKNAG